MQSAQQISHITLGLCKSQAQRTSVVQGRCVSEPGIMLAAGAARQLKCAGLGSKAQYLQLLTGARCITSKTV